VNEVTDGGADGDRDGRCARCAEREAELEELRAQVARLRSENAALLQAAINRDYERPPHY
jgi:uncharacterized coiled-coil protein SlyX